MSARRLLLHAIAVAALAAAAASAFPAERSQDLFSSSRTLTVELKAPFEDLFTHARDDGEYEVAGSLAYTDDGQRGTIENVKVSLRGHTSRRESECAFPKLKLTLGDTSTAPLFAGRSNVKVGTHCDDKDGLTPRFGRLANERSPWREAFVYRLLDVFGVPALKARPARITYVFADGSGGDTRGGRQLVKNALLLEDDKDARRRFGADREIPEADFTNAAEMFAPADVARLAFAQALIGNFDWCLRMSPNDAYRCNARHPLWNILAFAANDRVTPVAYDFDVSGMVAGSHSWFRDVYNDAFVSTKSHATVEVLGQLQRTRSLFPRPLLDATRAAFMKRKADAYAALTDAPLDEGGRKNIAEYLDSFFAGIETNEAFYRAVVTKPGTSAWNDAAHSSRACGERSAVPVGTPVSDPVETQNGAIRVILLDVFWRWAPPSPCDAVHRGAVWIDEGAIGRDYPK